MKLVAARAGIPPDHRLSYLGAFTTRGDEVFAVGGAYSTPTLLRSRDGGASFEAWPTPKTPGLRDMVFVDDAVWVVGEEGLVAHTRDAGATWTQVPVETDRCVYTIARDAGGRLWLGGEGGFLVRQGPGDAFQRIPRRSKENVFDIFFDDDGTTWVMGISMLQRWSGKKLVTIQLAGRPTIARIARTAAGTLVAIGRDGVALRSTDRGATWDKSAVDVGHDSLEAIAVTPYGIFVAGPGLLVSRDDGASFARVETDVGKLWAVGYAHGALLAGGSDSIDRIPARELAKLLLDDGDPVVAQLARRVADADDGAELVLEDALRERGRL